MSRKAKIVVAIAAVIAVAAIAFFGVKNQMRKNTDDENVIKIGAILPLTGSLGYEGTRMKDAMELAISQLDNDKRGVLKIYYEDGKFLVRDSISAFNKLNEKGMDAWIVFGDTPLLGMKPLLKKTGKPVLCLIGAQELIKDSPNFFHFSGSITLPAVKNAQFVKTKGVKTVSIIYLNEQIGLEVKRAFEQEFMDKSHKVVTSEGFDMGQRSMKDLVVRSIAPKPDAVFVYGYSTPYIDILNELKNVGYRGLVITDGNLGAVKSSLIGGGDGVWYADFDFGDGCDNPESQKFVNDMKNIYGVSASSFSAFAYETVRVLAAIVHHSGKTSSAIHSGLLSIKNYHSIFGVISYRDNRELDIPIVIKKATPNGAKIWRD